MEFKQILEKIMELKGWKRPQLIANTGLAQSTVYSILNGQTTDPGYSFLKKLLQNTGISPRFLLTGKDPVFEKVQISDEAREWKAKYDALQEELERTRKFYTEELRRERSYARRRPGPAEAVIYERRGSPKKPAKKTLLRRILVVEDDCNDREIISWYLKGRYDVIYRCFTGTDAILHIRAVGYMIDYMIIDYKLPDVPAEEVIQVADQYGLFSVIISGIIDKPDIDIPFLKKPFQKEDLLNCVAGNEKLSA